MVNTINTLTEIAKIEELELVKKELEKKEAKIRYLNNNERNLKAHWFNLVKDKSKKIEELEEELKANEPLIKEIKELEKYIEKNLTSQKERNERIIARLERKWKYKKEETEEEETIYYEIGKPEELLEKSAGKGKVGEVAIEMIEKLEQDVVIHLEANKKGMEKPWNKELLVEEIREKSDMLHESDEEVKSQRLKIEELQKLLEEERREKMEIVKDFEEEVKNLQAQKEVLRKEVVEEKNKTKKWEWKFHLATNSLPKTPNKLKILKGKAKIKIQHLVEKSKQRSQELIAKIEVKVK